MVIDCEIEESVQRYFEAISKSDIPLQVSLSDEKNKKLNNLCKKLDQLYLLRSKLKKEFFEYLQSDQYYYDIYQTIKYLNLNKPPLKKNFVGFDSNSHTNHNNFIDAYIQKLSSFKKINHASFEENKIELKKIKKFVDEYLIDIMITDLYEAIWTFEDMEKFYGPNGPSRSFSISETEDNEGHLKKLHKIFKNTKLSLKKKPGEKLSLYRQRIKKMLLKMPEENPYSLSISKANRFKLYCDNGNIYFLLSFEESLLNIDDTFTEYFKNINFDLGFSDWFINDGYTVNSLLVHLLNKIYLKKSRSIEAKYREEIFNLEHSIRFDCLNLRKKMNINYSISLCEKLINNYFKTIDHLYNSKWQNLDYMELFKGDMVSTSFFEGKEYKIYFDILSSEFDNKQYLDHPININVPDLITSLEVFISQHFRIGHYSELFGSAFVNNNTIHDGNPEDKYGDPMPGYEDWYRGRDARISLSKDLYNKFQNFISNSSGLKNQQRNIDWIQIELINYLEDNQDIFIAKTNKFKNFKLINNKNLLIRIKEILNDYEDYEKEIKKITNEVYLKYKSITKNHTVFNNRTTDALIKYEKNITKANPKHSKFAINQIALYEDPYTYDYRDKADTNYKYIQDSMKEAHDLEPFSSNNIFLIRNIVNKNELLEEDYKKLNEWFIKYSKINITKGSHRFLPSYQQKIFNVDNFFKFEEYYLDSNNLELKNLLSQLFNYINIDQSIATIFQDLIEEKNKQTGAKAFDESHYLFDKFPQIKIKNKTEYETSVWWLLYNFINAQKSQIYHSYNNSIKDIILRTLLFLNGIYPYRSGYGIKDPYERVTTELTKVINFYDNVLQQLFKDKISIAACLATNEITNSLRCIREYIHTLKRANAYEIHTNYKNNSITNKDIAKDDLKFISKSPKWYNEIPNNHDLAIKKYLKSFNKKNKTRDTGFIDKQIYNSKSKKLKTSKRNKALVERMSAIKWLKERPGRGKLYNLKMDSSLNKDICFNNYGLYLVDADTHIEYNN